MTTWWIESSIARYHSSLSFLRLLDNPLVPFITKLYTTYTEHIYSINRFLLRDREN